MIISFLIHLLMQFLLGAAMVLSVRLLGEYLKQQETKTKRKQFVQQQFSNPLYEGLTPATESKMLWLTGGDRALAERLVDQIQSNTGQSAQWCWEKAILDLERDRRS